MFDKFMIKIDIRIWNMPVSDFDFYVWAESMTQLLSYTFNKIISVNPIDDSNRIARLFVT